MIKNILSLIILIFLTSTSHGLNFPNKNSNYKSIDEAFQVFFDLNSNKLDFHILEGYQLYKDKIFIKSNEKDYTQELSFPKATINKFNEKVFIKDFSIYISENIYEDFEVKYQGCSEGGFCYPPKIKTFKYFKGKVKENNKYMEIIKNQSIPVTLIIFFFIGVLISFTPCVLPMMPLVLNIIYAHHTNVKKKSLLAFSYITGMATTYAFIGLMVSYIGYWLQSFLQSNFLMIPLITILTILALYQLDLLKLNFLHKINRKLHIINENIIQGSMVGSFGYGMISGLIVSPCVTPALVGVLSYMSQYNNPILGSVTLFVMALGMGSPLLILATGTNYFIPQNEKFSVALKHVSAYLILLLCIWLIYKSLGIKIAQISGGILAISTGVFLQSFQPVKNKNTYTLIKKSSGMTISLFGAIMIFNALTFQQNYYNKNNSSYNYETDIWKIINTEEELNVVLATNRKTFLILKIDASWCSSCAHNNNVLAQPNILPILDNFSTIKIDLTKPNEKIARVIQRYKIFGPPTLLILETTGLEVNRVTGSYNQDEIINLLKKYY